MNGKKTKKMKAVEAKFGEPLETMLPRMVTDMGLSETADHLGIAKASLGYWILKMGMEIRRVCLAPGESIEIKRNG